MLGILGTYALLRRCDMSNLVDTFETDFIVER